MIDGTLPTPASPLPPAATDPAPSSAAAGRPARRFAFAITGSGHFLEESLALARRLPGVDLLLSAAGEEVLPMYGHTLESLKQHFRVVRDKTASAVPVGQIYEEAYHTIVVAPATSNTVAKIAYGLSDTLPTNMVTQAGKLGIPSIVFACDTEPVVLTTAPKTSDQAWFTLRPRRIELDNVERLRAIEFIEVVCDPAQLEAALARRLDQLGLAWLA